MTPRSEIGRCRDTTRAGGEVGASLGRGLVQGLGPLEQIHNDTIIGTQEFAEIQRYRDTEIRIYASEKKYKRNDFFCLRTQMKEQYLLYKAKEGKVAALSNKRNNEFAS